MTTAVERSMILPMVQQIMVKDNNPDAWRKNLIQLHIFEAQEAKDLSDRELSLIHHALLVQKFSQLPTEELLREAEKHQVQYHVSFDQDDFQMGAVCY